MAILIFHFPQEYLKKSRLIFKTSRSYTGDRVVSASEVRMTAMLEYLMRES